MIKKNIKLLHFTDIIKTYIWSKGSGMMMEVITNYYRDNFKIKEIRRWQGTQGDWNLEIDYVAAGKDFVEPKESLFQYAIKNI